MLYPIIILALLIIVLGLVFYILYLKFSKKYTREKFAFFSVTSIVSLASSFLVQIKQSTDSISAFQVVYNSVFSAHLEVHRTVVEDHILFAIIVISLIILIYGLHRNWNGPVSELYFERKIHSETPPTLIDESFLQLADFFRKNKAIKVHIDNERGKKYNVFTPYEDEKMPWYESVFELLSYADRQYKIDINKDYYQDDKVLLSKYGQSNQSIAIFCSLDTPKESAIRNFILFCRKQKDVYSKYIIAIKNERAETKIENHLGVDIHFRYESEMLDSLIDVSNYRQYIRDQYTRREITFGTKFTLQDMYVELKGKNEEDTIIPKVEDYVYKWLNNSDDNKQLAILGEYGCGKSVLSLKLTYELLENRTSNSRIPILIELRGKSPRNLTVTELLANWAHNFRLEAAAILKLHKAGKLLIIFEGFDEMDMIGDREMRLDHFRKLWEFAMPKAKIIITGRPNFFLDDRELKINLGIDKPKLQNSTYCEAIYLEKFDIDQIKLALRKVDRSTCDQILSIITTPSNKNLLDLVSRPAILYLVAVIWKERQLSQFKDNINSSLIISEFIKYTYSRQNEKSSSFPLTDREREYFMIGVAVGMWQSTGFTNQISKNDLEAIILKLYKNFPDGIYRMLSATQTKKKPLKERMVDNPHAEDTILTDVRSCGILVNDLTRNGYFKFAHKSFLEYQVSLFFVESIVQDKGEYNLMTNAIMSSFSSLTPSTLKQTDETIFFIAELLISKMQLNSTTEPVNTCRSLFKILYPLKTLKRSPRLAAYAEILLISKYQPFFMLAFSIPLTYSLFFIKSPEDHEILFISMVAITFIYVGLLSSILKTRTMMNGRSRSKMAVWLKCCTLLNLPEEVLYKVVPKKYVKALSANSGPLFFDIAMQIFPIEP